MNDVCMEEILADWPIHICGRRVQRDEMCGIHALAADRREYKRRREQRTSQTPEERQTSQAERYCLCLQVLGVACATDGERIYLLDPAGLSALTPKETP